MHRLASGRNATNDEVIWLDLVDRPDIVHCLLVLCAVDVFDDHPPRPDSPQDNRLDAQLIPVQCFRSTTTVPAQSHHNTSAVAVQYQYMQGQIHTSGPPWRHHYSTNAVPV